MLLQVLSLPKVKQDIYRWHQGLQLTEFQRQLLTQFWIRVCQVVATLMPLDPVFLLCQEPVDYRAFWACVYPPYPKHSIPPMPLPLRGRIPKPEPLPAFPLLNPYVGPHLLPGPGALLCISAYGQGPNSWPRFWMLLLQAEISFPSPSLPLHLHPSRSCG